MSARYLVGDVFDRLAALPDGSVDLILTSPPFLALRSYLPPDHPDKGKEIGSEPTPAAFIDTLLALTVEWRRVLAPHGSICVELGDTYSGSGGAGGDYNDGGLRDGQHKFDGSSRRSRSASAWPLAKSLCLIPESYRWALVYGRNPFGGLEVVPWMARNVVRWCRPNPAVGALGDKVRPATSDMVVACTSRTRFFDLDAIRKPSSPNTHARIAKGAATRTDLPSQQRDGNWATLPQTNDSNPAGAPPLDHWWHDEFPQDAWSIPTAPYSGSHYAVWPPALLVDPIKSMCPERVCRTCGEPSRRITERTPEYAAAYTAAYTANAYTAANASAAADAAQDSDKGLARAHHIIDRFTELAPPTKPWVPKLDTQHAVEQMLTTTKETS